MPTLRWYDLGRVEYDAARALQSRLAAERAAGVRDDLLLLLEHPPVLTVGRNAPLPASGGVPVVRTDRGGKLTYHGPGQLVGYPVVALRAAGRGVRDFVARLERALCATAARFAVDATTVPGLPGVWTTSGGERRKLASIGLAVRRGVTLHGCALNVDRRAEDGFAGLEPCGLPGVRMTSLVGAGARADLTVAEVALELARTLADTLGSDAEHGRDDDLEPKLSPATDVAALAAPSHEGHGHQPSS